MLHEGSQFDDVVVGAGVAGLWTAYFLATQHKRKVLLVDEHAPLSETSRASTECYRHWYPSPDMNNMVGRSLQILESLANETNNTIALSRKGYLLMSANPSVVETRFKKSAANPGVGDPRFHTNLAGLAGAYTNNTDTGFSGIPRGCDIASSKEVVHHIFPFVNEDFACFQHIRHAGWIDVASLGVVLLERFAAAGGVVHQGRFTSIRCTDQSVVSHVAIDDALGRHFVPTKTVVFAVGPHLPALLKKVFSLTVPVQNELHAKVVIDDYLNILPRTSPMLFGADDIRLAWNDGERKWLSDSAHATAKELLQPREGGIHCRPVGNGTLVYGIWTYLLEERSQGHITPPPVPPFYGDVVVRGIAAVVPDFAAYFDMKVFESVCAKRGLNPADVIRSRAAVAGMVDEWKGDLGFHSNGVPSCVKAVVPGYYCKTAENKPAVGPLKLGTPQGVYLCGALSGFGIMMSPAAGELAAAHICTPANLPSYAEHLLPSRLNDPAYLAEIEKADPLAGQF